MNPDRIKQILSEELEESDTFNWPEPHLHEASYYLTEPFQGDFFNHDTQEIEKHWIVANMNPDNPNDGALIIYDEESHLFGLAGKGNLFEEGEGELTGWYGGLRETLEYL